MRFILVVIVIAFVLGFSLARAEPQFAIQAPDSPVAPTAIAVISCQVDDLGLANLPENVIAAVPEWKNLDWRRDKSGELICKREIIEIQDKDQVVNNSVQLHHNFGDPTQCVRGAALFFTMNKWDEHHQNWSVIAVGCPSPVTDETGRIISWVIPSCPSHVPGNDSMPLKCRFSEDSI